MSIQHKGYILQLDTLPMPPTRQDRLTAIGSILDSGGVQKLTIEVGKGIKALRWVKDELEGIPQEVLSDHVLAATRNCEMEECSVDDNPSPLSLLFRGFSMVSKKGLQPIKVAVRSFTQFRKWAGIDPLADTGEVFCVPIIQSGSVPENVVLIIAANRADPEEVEYSVRLDMEDSKT